MLVEVRVKMGGGLLDTLEKIKDGLARAFPLFKGLSRKSWPCITPGSTSATRASALSGCGITSCRTGALWMLPKSRNASCGRSREGAMSENRIQGWKAICEYLGQSAYRIRRQCYPVYHMPESRLVWAVPGRIGRPHGPAVHSVSGEG